MADINTINFGSNVTYTIKVNGSAIPNKFMVYAVHVEKKVNRIATAKVVILDGETNTGTFEASSSSTFIPGGELSIEAGYESKNQLIYKGIITNQILRIDGSIGSALEVISRDASIKMSVGRKSKTFAKQKDSAIISSIVGTYSGISATVSATNTVWPEQVQYYVSDWDFILTRAEANGMMVTTSNGKVTVQKPDANTSPVLTVGYGDGLISFNANLNAVTQLGSVKANAWDYKTQKLNSGQSNNNYPGPGNLSSKKLSQVIGLSSYELRTGTALDTSDLTEWSKAELVKSEFSKIQGEAKFQGNNLAEPGKYIRLSGLGDRFNGDYFISGIAHDISEGNWFTEVTLGMPSVWFTEEPDVMAPPASGLLPGARGLFNATVKKINGDPDGQYRILISIPLFDADGEGLWARLSNFYSTNGAGAFFLPEVGDEVIVGFVNEDPRYPIILGSLYSSSKIKPFKGLEPNEKNSKKAIVSKSNIYLEFDDENKVLTITTPGKNTFVLSDKDKKISLKDENSNSIEMSSSGITISSPKNITLKANQTIQVQGTQGIKAESSTGDVEVKGMNVKETATMQYTVQGQMTKINGGAQLALKGAMVMIN